MGVETGFLEWLVTQTGPVVGLVLALWFMQQNQTAYMGREKENAAVHREDKERLLVVLERNTEANVRLAESLIRLEQTLIKREQ